MSTNTDVILIKYQSDMSDLKKELVALTASNKKIETELKNIGAAGKKAGAEAAEGFKKVGAVTKGLEGTFNSLKSQIAGVFAVQQLKQFVAESVKAAAAAEGIERAFNRIAPEGTLNKLREATKGTVSDVQLMANAVKANNFQIPIENLAGLFKFAQQRARETGESVDYLVDSIVLGIGRKSPLILDNLGISAVRLREKFKGLNADQVDVAAVAQAVGEIVAEENEKMGASIDTTADRLARWGAEWENLKRVTGDYFIEAGVYFEELVKNFSWRDLAPGGLLGGEAFEKAGQYTQAMRDAAAAEAQFNDALTRTTKEIKGLTDAQIQEQLVIEQNAVKSGFAAGMILQETNGKIKAYENELVARQKARDAERQYREADIKQLEAWVELGDTAAQKEISRRNKIETKRKAALAEQVKNEKDSLEKLLFENERIYSGLENIQKQRFVNREIDEKKLSSNLSMIEQSRLINLLNTLKKQTPKTQEAIKEKEKAILAAENALTNAQVEAVKEKNEELIKIEEDRFSITFSDYENYWRDITALNTYFLEQGVYTQKEFDKIQGNNEVAALEQRLKMLREFEVDKNLSAEEQKNFQENINKEIAQAEDELNKKRLANFKETEEQKTEEAKKQKEKQKDIAEQLYNSTKELTSSFIDFNRERNKEAADAEIERQQEVLDKQLENEFLTEQQREALQEQFDERRRQILNEQASREKQAKIAEAVIDGIVSVIAAKSLPEKIIVGALNAAQLALLIAAPLPQYKEGDVDIQGPGTDTSDSILARISRGESVINARATRKHKDILKVINRGTDDELMKLIKVKYYPADEKPEKKAGFADNLVNQLKLQSKFDDSNIVKAIKGTRPATASDIKKLGDTITKGNREAALLNKLK